MNLIAGWILTARLRLIDNRLHFEFVEAARSQRGQPLLEYFLVLLNALVSGHIHFEHICNWHRLKFL